MKYDIREASDSKEAKLKLLLKIILSLFFLIKFPVKRSSTYPALYLMYENLFVARRHCDTCVSTQPK